MKKKIKDIPVNKLIIDLVDTYAVIVSKNGHRCKTEDKELNIIANELKERGLLTEEDITHLNM